MNFIMDIKKQRFLNKNISKEIGQNVVGIYKRSSNILKSEISKNKIELSNSVDTWII